MKSNSVDLIFRDMAPQLTGSLDFFFTVGPQMGMSHEQVEENIKAFTEAQWMVEESRADKIAASKGLSKIAKNELILLFMKRHNSIWGIYSSPDSYELSQY